jgi:hypothetical protein
MWRYTRCGTAGCSGLQDAVRYLPRHREFLHYEQALEAGWPIATGAVEGTARHLIGDRLEITGACVPSSLHSAEPHGNGLHAYYQGSLTF